LDEEEDDLELDSDFHPMDPAEVAALLEPDSDIIALPVIEVVFGETVHELFYTSSDAYKAARRQAATTAAAAQRQLQAPLVDGPLLFAEEDSLLGEPLTVLFSRLRSLLIETRYGAEDAEHYEMHLTFKGLDDLWLPEHEGAASRSSLSSLVQLYSDISEGSGQGVMQLEPFRIELTVHETFASRLNGLQAHGTAAKARQQQQQDVQQQCMFKSISL
jgi:hypothetical protein